jgi:hypothetical protein
VLKFCSAPFANTNFSSIMRTCCPTRYFTLYSTNAIIHLLPYRDNIRIGHSWWRHGRSRVNRVIVSCDRFWENVDISIFLYVRFLYSLSQIVRSARSMKELCMSGFYTPETECPPVSTCVETAYLKFFAFIRSHPHRMQFTSRIFPAIEYRLKRRRHSDTGVGP